MKKTLILLAGCLLGASAFAACYNVMDSKGNIISQSPNPPVDMSEQLHETVPSKYGAGASVTFGIADTDCGETADTWEDHTSPKAAAKKGKRAAHHARPHHKAQPKQTAAAQPKETAAQPKAAQPKEAAAQPPKEAAAQPKKEAASHPKKEVAAQPKKEAASHPKKAARPQHHPKPPASQAQAQQPAKM